MPRALRATWPRGHVLAAIRTWPRGHVPNAARLGLLAASLGLTACFTPPADAVLFACTAKAPDCPTDYTCADDGCCHRDGSDIAANYGACGLGGPATGPLATSTDVGTDVGPTSTDASSTGAPTTTGTPSTAPSTSADASSTSTGADTSTTSATDASSTSASTGP